MTTVRNYQLDGIKYLLICLVVICHLMQGVRYANPIFQCIYSVVYSFHMPLFVLLSGFFFHKTEARDIHRSNLRLLEPLVIYHFLFIHSSDWKSYLFFEPSPLWYLLSLICWRWIIYGIEKTLLAIKKRICYVQALPQRGGGIFIITTSVILSIIATFMINEKYCSFMSIMRTFQFLPFFSIGHVLTNNFLYRLQSGGTCKILMLLVLVTIILLCLFSGPCLNAILFSKYNLYSLSSILGLSLFASFCIKIIVAVASLVLCFGVLSLKKIPEWLSSNGGTTLFILCVHSLIYYFAQGVNNVFLAFAIAVSAIVLLSLMAKTKYANWMLYPISTVKSFFLK